MKNKLLLIVFTLTCIDLFGQVLLTDSIPVRLSYINGERLGNNNRIDWKVACFLQHANFEIQRSADNINFETVHSFQADELRCREPFFYTDNTATSDKSFYRIKVGDIDGRFYSSGIIALYKSPDKMDITAITPSISTGKFSLQVSSASADKADIIITTSGGKIVHQQSLRMQKGNNTVNLLLNHLSAGLHYITIISSTRQVSKSSFIKI